MENETGLATMKFLREVKEEAEERIDDDALKINDILFDLLRFLIALLAVVGSAAEEKEIGRINASFCL